MAKPKHFQQLIDHIIVEPERKILVFEQELEPEHYRCPVRAWKIEFWNRTGSTALVGTELLQDFLLYTSPCVGHSASKCRIGVCSTGCSGPNSFIRHKMICDQRVTLFENIYSNKRRDDRQVILQWLFLNKINFYACNQSNGHFPSGSIIFNSFCKKLSSHACWFDLSHYLISTLHY